MWMRPRRAVWKHSSVSRNRTLGSMSTDSEYKTEWAKDFLFSEAME